MPEFDTVLKGFELLNLAVFHHAGDHLENLSGGLEDCDMEVNSSEVSDATTLQEDTLVGFASNLINNET